MDSFSKFLESDLDSTRVSYKPNVINLSQIKEDNINAANQIIKIDLNVTLGQSRHKNIKDMIAFADRHDFDDSMPLSFLINVYKQFR